MKRNKILPLLLAIALLTGCAGAAEPVTPITQPTATTPQEPVGFALGNKIPEMSMDITQGESLDLYSLLEEHKLVVLNFWFADCIWCQREFPVMELAYHRYQQDVEIVALSPSDTMEEVAAFQKDHSLTFPMGTCGRGLTTHMGVVSYPTSVFIDRYGKICLIHVGAITDVQIFYDLFNHFTADDYQSMAYESLSDLLS